MSHIHRRAFLGSTAAAVAAAAGGIAATPLVAKKRDDTPDPLIDHATREAVRIHKGIAARGGVPNVHDIQAFESNLALTALALRQPHIEELVRTAALKRRGDREGLLNEARDPSHAEHRRAEVRKRFPDLDIDHPAENPPSPEHYRRALAILETPNGLADFHDEFSRAVGQLKTRAAKAQLIEGGRRVRLAQGSIDAQCGMYRNALSIAETFRDVVCAIAWVLPEIIPICVLGVVEYAAAWWIMWYYC